MWYQYMYILPHVKWHVSNGTYMTFWHCEKAITLKTKPSQKRKIFCHLCNQQYGFMFWKTCIYVISIVNFISVHSVYMNLLYIQIFTRNKVQRAIKHVCVTYFCIFMEMPSKFATACLGGYIWQLICKGHIQLAKGGISDGYSRNDIWTCELQFVGGMGGYIWWLFCKWHLKMWTQILCWGYIWECHL